jgi:integrase
MNDICRIIAEINDPGRVREILYGPGGQPSPTGHSRANPIEAYYAQYLERRQNRSPATRAQYKRTLPEFIVFAVEFGVDYPEELSTAVVEGYIDELFDAYDRDATILTYTKNVRAWLAWLEKRTPCDEELPALLTQDELGLSPKARDEAIPVDEATDILDQLRKQRHGTALHALMELFWNVGSRIGGARSLDLSDVHLQENELRFLHRPETGTRLKNGDSSDGTAGDGERVVSISDELADALKAYIRVSRPDVTDEYGREPLFTTSHGRAARSTLRRWTYEATDCRWTRERDLEIPCSGGCDSDSNICPHSYYPHAIRRGAIVAHLSAGLQPDRAAGRFDVSYNVLKKHYDPRTKREKKRDRADAVRHVWNQI